MAGLASAGGVVVEMMNLSSTADTISNEVDRAAIELSEKYERTEEARKAYLAAEDELNFNIKKTPGRSRTRAAASRPTRSARGSPSPGATSHRDRKHVV